MEKLFSLQPDISPAIRLFSPKLVLAFITRNSHLKMQKAPVSLKNVLNSTLQIPYTHIILVDDSTDETQKVFHEWCEAHEKDLLVSNSKTYGYDKATRATARQTAIDIFLENFSHKWILFIDDDVVLNSGWWSETEEHLENPKIGLVWGLNFDAYPDSHTYLKTLGIDYVGHMISEFYRRGGMHDTLLRREAIEDIKIPPDLHVFEDWYVLQHVQKKGYDTAIIKAGVTHYNPDWNYSRTQLWEMAHLAKKYGVEPSTLSYRIYRFARSMTSIVPTAYASIKSFGVKKGISRAFQRWRVKVLYRAFMLLGS